MALLSTLMILNILGSMAIGFADGEKVVEIELDSGIAPELLLDENATAEEIYWKIMAQIEKEKTKSINDR